MTTGIVRFAVLKLDCGALKQGLRQHSVLTVKHWTKLKKNSKNRKKNIRVCPVIPALQAAMGDSKGGDRGSPPFGENVGWIRRAFCVVIHQFGGLRQRTPNPPYICIRNYICPPFFRVSIRSFLV